MTTMPSERMIKTVHFHLGYAILWWLVAICALKQQTTGGKLKGARRLALVAR